MTQARKSRIPARLWIPLAGVAAVAVALLQGLGVFAVWGFAGSFLSATGAECVAVPLGIELVLLVVILKNLDELHARSVSNPHSLLGQALRPRPNSRVTRCHFDKRQPKIAVAISIAVVRTFTTDFCDTKNGGIPSTVSLSRNP